MTVGEFKRVGAHCCTSLHWSEVNAGPWIPQCCKSWEFELIAYFLQRKHQRITLQCLLWADNSLEIPLPICCFLEISPPPPCPFGSQGVIKSCYRLSQSLGDGREKSCCILCSLAWVELPLILPHSVWYRKSKDCNWMWLLLSFWTHHHWLTQRTIVAEWKDGVDTLGCKIAGTGLRWLTRLILML